MTLEDMYNNQYDFDDEDDDSDWEPLQKPAAIVKWFCVNCTMVNLGDDIHCDVRLHCQLDSFRFIPCTLFIFFFFIFLGGGVIDKFIFGFCVSDVIICFLVEK